MTDSQMIRNDDPPGDEEASGGVSLEVSAFRRVLRNRGFMALWAGQSISGIGDWVIVGVLLDMVNRLGQGPGLALMMTFRFLPAFLFGLVAGAVVDRLERKSLLITCEIARAALVVLLAFSNSLGMICALVFFIECFTLLYGPARDSSIPELVAESEVMNANSLMSTSTYLTMAIGTMIATVILGLADLIYKSIPFLGTVITQMEFQHKFAFIVDALTFLASAFLIFTIAFPKRFKDKQKINARNVFSDLKEGVYFMRTNALTRAILGVMIIGFIGGGSVYILGAPFAQQVLSATGSKFTLILTFLLFGVVIGAALAPLLSKRFSPEKWFGRAVFGFGADIILFSLIDVYVLSLVVILFGGVLLGYLLVSAYTLLHHNLEEEIRGRVFAAMQTIMRTCLLVSMGVFATVAWLFSKWIPWKPEKPVHKIINFGFVTKSIYPSMLALMIGGVLVIIGGIISMRSIGFYFQTQRGEIEGGSASAYKGNSFEP